MCVLSTIQQQVRARLSVRVEEKWWRCVEKGELAFERLTEGRAVGVVRKRRLALVMVGKKACDTRREKERGKTHTSKRDTPAPIARLRGLS